MKLSKKILSVLLSAVMAATAVCSISVNAFAASSNTVKFTFSGT